MAAAAVPGAAVAVAVAGEVPGGVDRTVGPVAPGPVVPGPVVPGPLVPGPVGVGSVGSEITAASTSSSRSPCPSEGNAQSTTIRQCPAGRNSRVV